MFARTDGKRKKGKPARRWLDDIAEWNGGNIWMAKRQAELRRGFWEGDSVIGLDGLRIMGKDGWMAVLFIYFIKLS